MLDDFEENIELLKKLLSDAMTVRSIVFYLNQNFKTNFIYLRLNNGNFFFEQMVMIMIHNIIIEFKI